MIAADHDSPSRPLTGDLWYDEAPPWAWISSAVADASDVRYERLSLT